MKPSPWGEFDLIRVDDGPRAWAMKCALRMYYQSLGQLAAAWPDDQGQTILSNATQIHVGINDNQTAEMV